MLAGGVVMAQTEQQSEQVMALFNQLPEDVQNNILDESREFETYCLGIDTYSEYHDCECLAHRFFEERVKRGPRQHMYSLFGDLKRECPDIAGMAGKSYDSCMRIMVSQPENIEKVCTCYANNLARAYAEHPNPDYRYVMDLGSNVMVKCRMKVRQGLE